MTVMNRAWDLIGLEACPGAFQWEQDEIPVEWQTVAGWHGDVSASSGIHRAPAESEEQLQGRFDGEAENAPRLLELLDHHLPFYRKLSSRVIETD